METLQKQITEFKFFGLKRVPEPENIMAGCEVKGSDDDNFYCPIRATQETKEWLWSYCKNNWADEKVAYIEHDGIAASGKPINPLFVGFRET